MPPFGYRRTTNGAFIQDQHESTVVQRIFSDYANGHLSARVIADRLNIDGILKPGSRTKGLSWVPDTVVDIVQNVAYIGKTYSISRARREGNLIGASWDSIIDPKLFEAAKNQVVRNRRGGGWTAARARHYAFQGLLECAHCGRRCERRQTTRPTTTTVETMWLSGTNVQALVRAFVRSSYCPGPSI